jgi:hypothetical protein
MVTSRHTAFARLLGRSGFDESNLRYEVVGHVTHGPVGVTPDCEAHGGAVALFANAALGWAVPRHAGWIELSWISSRSAAPGALIVDYLPPPIVVHYHDPYDLEVRSGGPARLQLRAGEAAVAELIWLAGASLPERDR